MQFVDYPMTLKAPSLDGKQYEKMGQVWKELAEICKKHKIAIITSSPKEPSLFEDVWEITKDDLIAASRSLEIEALSISCIKDYNKIRTSSKIIYTCPKTGKRRVFKDRNGVSGIIE